MESQCLLCNGRAEVREVACAASIVVGVKPDGRGIDCTDVRP